MQWDQECILKADTFNGQSSGRLFVPASIAMTPSAARNKSPGATASNDGVVTPSVSISQLRDLINGLNQLAVQQEGTFHYLVTLYFNTDGRSCSCR